MNCRRNLLHAAPFALGMLALLAAPVTAHAQEETELEEIEPPPPAPMPEPVPAPVAPPTPVPSATPAVPATSVVPASDEGSYGESREGDADDQKFAWETAGRHYVVPLAFFSIHGYLEGVWASKSPDWTAPDPTQLPMPGQLLVPNTSDNSFQYDAAIFISTDTSAHTRSLLELHFVSNPSGEGTAGPGGLTVAITEASVSWDLYKTYLTLGGGLYWAPFGIVNIDWLGGQALFQLVPRASAAFPTHFNERGVRLNGSKAFSEGFGMNYVVSLGNGVHTFDISGQRSYDRDGDKTFIGRLGLFPGLGADLELGYSFAAGVLRDKPSPMIMDPSDVRRYPGDFVAHGADLTWKLADLKLRSYYIWSLENLDQADPAEATPEDINRQGFMAEMTYDFWTYIPIGKIRSIAPKARVDFISVDALATDGLDTNNFQTAVYSAGIDIKSAGTVGAVLSLEYHIQDELKGQDKLDNNRFIARLLAKF